MKKVLANVDWLTALPEELFDEAPTKPDVGLEKVAYSAYTHDLLGNSDVTLHLGSDGGYYVHIMDTEPIGDYGIRYVDRWFRCKDIQRVDEIVRREAEEVPDDE